MTGAGEDLEPGPGSRAAAASGLSHTMTDTRSPFLRPTAQYAAIRPSGALDRPNHL